MRKLTLSGLIVPFLLASACSKTGTPGAPATAATADPAFAGSASCQGCHEPQYRDWMGSHHQLAMQVATADTVLGDFDDASVDYFGTSTQFFTRDDGYYVRTADGDGASRDFRIAYTFGVEPLQQYLIEFPGGRLQTLAFSWDTRPAADGGQRWFHQYPDEYIAPDDELHWTGRQQNWNYMCAECHSTNVDMAYDPASDSFATTYAEISVGCEGCHGPGSQHVERARTGIAGSHSGFPVDLDDHGSARWIMNGDTGIAARSEPRTGPPQQPESCGRCHSRRGIIAGEYEYGRPLADTHMPALLDEGLYFADGQILDEVYVYGSFLQSRMYQAGVTCSDCHNPHSAELVTGGNPNDVCAQCHLPARFAAPDHGGHLPAQAGCVDCHMTDRTYMVVDDRRDHSFRIPQPDLSEALSAPHACSACHDDRDADWATATIEAWRGARPAPAAHFGASIAAGRRGFANDRLLDVVNDPAYPGIARATAVSLLAPPFGSGEFRALEAQFGNADPLIRIAALRQLRSLPGELRLRLSGHRLLRDPVRGVRLEAVSSYAGMQDLLPVEDARAYTEAERELRDTYTAIANRPEALVSLGNFEAAEGDVDAAIALYRRALDMEPMAVTARAHLADALRSRGDEAAAESALREGLALDEGNAALHHTLGLSLVRSGRADEALDELRRAAELAPDVPRYVYVLGIAVNSLGSAEEALRLMTEAYRDFPTDFDIAMGLATLRRDNGDTEGALAVAYELARRHPEEQSVLGLLRSLGAVP